MTSNDPNRVRFGPYEADLRTHELWKFGTKLKLVGQPFEILAVLVSRPGELVTRDELRSRLWPAETFVDFNHGLNAAVNKLREALSDSAEDPRYIETLPRRGYRFIGNVEVVPSNPVAEAIRSAPEEPEIAPPPATGQAEPAPTLPSKNSPWVLRALGVAILVIGLAFVGSALLYLHFQHGSPVSSVGVASPMKGWQRVTISGKGRYEGPQLSPDGSRIVFMSNRSGGMDIWTCNVDGSELKQVTTLGDAGTPRWSPDGKTIAFDSRMHNYGGSGTTLTQSKSEGVGAILLVDVATGTQRFLVVGNSDNVVPSWSRDGKFIYFASNRTGSWQIWKTALDGTAPKQITRRGGFAAWESVDGKYLYYTYDNQPNPEVRRVSVDGGDETTVSALVRPVTWAGWSLTADGIYFVSGGANNTPEVAFYDFASQTERQYTSLDAFPFWFTTSGDGKRAAFDRTIADGSAIVTIEGFQQ